MHRSDWPGLEQEPGSASRKPGGSRVEQGFPKACEEFLPEGSHQTGLKQQMTPLPSQALALSLLPSVSPSLK